MKLLVLAQTPPPIHGQSVMVETLVRGLPALGVEVIHIPLALSRQSAEIGKWSLRKMLLTVHFAWAARRAARRSGGCLLYYVPAPGKRGAIWRDLAVLAIVRSASRGTVLHWHAIGMSDWLTRHGSALERWAVRRWLGRPELSIVPSSLLEADARWLASQRIAVVPNAVPSARPAGPHLAQATKEVLFLAQCSAPKGLFEAVAAVLDARRAGLDCRLTAAGKFVTTAEHEAFDRLCAQHPGTIRYVGEVTGETKEALLHHSDCLCFPTVYPHEGQPLVILEALAHGLPVVSTRWRSIPDLVPATVGRIVAPGDLVALTQALVSILENSPDRALIRQHYERNFSVARHLAAMRDALALVG